MPKLPVVSGREVVRALERLGFRQVRQRGAHVIMDRDGRGCAVPLHRTVKIGTLDNILKQAGVGADELREVL